MKTETPELDKQAAARDEGSQEIGAFLDWLQNERKIELCEWDEETNDYFPVGKSIEQLLAEYFEIDLQKIEEERRALLAELRKEA